ncbi:T-cell activation Rho GTPase-activating protein-like [Anguilla anguilla]|uniref:T-cell activation Rho GTPase-activating protein-like n=1 Tax=Anguilla anguilla TaxID=7936 RepID=UPI0015B0344A|nr:T-cell activation Rho GTPase-activating protein-like [Anguilla anguilla]
MQKRGVLPSCTGGSWSPDRETGLYGRPLLSVCGHDRRLPRPIREVLAELWSRAPATEGVFRKPGNAKRLSEIKARLDAGEDLDAEAQPVLLLAALLKDFLRQLPDGLLGALLYPAWMSAMEKEEAQRCSELRQVSDRLPKANVHLLQFLLLVLRHISRSADANKMDARNLAVCISPNLLPVEPLSLDKVEKVAALTQFLIENCGEIFGDGPQTLAGDPAEEDRLADSTDSLSSHGQDSAYDSADPEAEADPAADRPPSPAAAQEMAVATPSRRPSCGASRRPGRPVCRRRSEPAKQAPSPSCRHLPQRLEPAMLHSASMDTLLTFAQGDEGVQPLAKQASYDSFLCPPGGQ